jgi:hypothetical protein
MAFRLANDKYKVSGPVLESTNDDPKRTFLTSCLSSAPLSTPPEMMAGKDERPGNLLYLLCIS